MPTPSRTSFQFSLREIMLVLTVCAALLALVLQNFRQLLPQEGSGLTEAFDLAATVNESAAELGIICNATSGGGRTGTVSSPTGCDVSKSCQIKIRQEDQVPFFKRFQDRIREILEMESCTVDGGGTGSHGFYWRFHNQRLQGVVKAEMLNDTPNPECVRINYFAVEFRK